MWYLKDPDYSFSNRVFFFPFFSVRFDYLPKCSELGVTFPWKPQLDFSNRLIAHIKLFCVVGSFCEIIRFLLNKQNAPT